MKSGVINAAICSLMMMCLMSALNAAKIQSSMRIKMFEHDCGECDFCEMNHKARTPAYCPECGAKLMHIYDDDSVMHED